MTDSNKKIARMPYIYYSICFQKSPKQKQIKTLFNSSGKINIMNLTFAQKSNSHLQKTNIRAQKINGFILET